MDILYVVFQYEYGNPARGFGYEHINFYDTMVRMGHNVAYFDYVELAQQLGRRAMNRRLWEMVEADKPALLFGVVQGEVVDRIVMRRISEKTDTVTLNWFTDDHWQFERYTHHWAPVYNWVTTTAASALPKYARLGYRNVIKTQWACNPHTYYRLDLPLKYDVTFVGQPHGNRRQVIKAIRRAGFEVQVWGYGWETGKLSHEDMVRIFNQSRINLNLSNASRRRDVLFPWRSKSLQQIKGRNFEVPGCGGFLLSGEADELEKYYEIGREIVCFKDTRDLIAKIRYYLTHDDERQMIAQAGYERTLREHTYERRFHEILQRVGLEEAPEYSPLKVERSNEAPCLR